MYCSFPFPITNPEGGYSRPPSYGSRDLCNLPFSSVHFWAKLLNILLLLLLLWCNKSEYIFTHSNISMKYVETNFKHIFDPALSIGVEIDIWLIGLTGRLMKQIVSIIEYIIFRKFLPQTNDFFYHILKSQLKIDKNSKLIIQNV